MRLRILRSDMNLKGKKVLVRIDANVPIAKGKAVDGVFGKVARAAVDLEWLSQKGAKVIVISHLGRPEGKRVSAYSLRPIAKRLEQLLKIPVKLSREIVGPKVLKLVEKMEDGEVLLLENIRFDAREKANAPSLAQALAQLADIYINDAFSVCHRAHASVDAITDELPSYAGPLIQNEIAILNKVIRRPQNPVILAVGGLKVRTKMPLLQRFLPKVDIVLVGGALGTAFLKAQDLPVGKSIYDAEGVPLARQLLKRWPNKIILPVDVKVAKSLRTGVKVRNVAVDEIAATDVIGDIGLETLKIFKKRIGSARTIIWNGPFGYCESKTFCKGTIDLAKAIAARTGKAVTVTGGGDTAPIVEAAKVAERYTLLSTGGGAMLAYLAGEELPGLEALKM
ncbi:phosphoglycerate kinase [Patescibacteria group bacterium]|nr:phosphoglycerate kinase [Patescibacteria group bacterium]MBU1705362.1 phosphoglycerate kinase [Patescibacteria group bacterium]